MTIKTKSFTHHPHVSLAWFSFCWWRHNRLLMTSQWPDNCDEITWIMISNSLDINFIHVDIYSRSCKKFHFSVYGISAHFDNSGILLTWSNFNSSTNKQSPPSKMWHEITYQFTDFNSAAVEVWKWISNFIPRFTGHVITDPCWDYT